MDTVDVSFCCIQKIIHCDKPGVNLQNHVWLVSSLMTHFDENGELCLGQMLEHVGSYKHSQSQSSLISKDIFTASLDFECGSLHLRIEYALSG